MTPNDLFTAVLAGIAFVVLPFLLIVALAVAGLGLGRLAHWFGHVFHDLASHGHRV
jgi:hypothetical protein